MLFLEIYILVLYKYILAHKVHLLKGPHPSDSFVSFFFANGKNTPNKLILMLLSSLKKDLGSSTI